jgi:methyl-accepting chemotaxis protein
VTKAITQLDTVIQQNASASEELAASSEELTGQAVELQRAVSFFVTGREVADLPAAGKPVGKPVPTRPNAKPKPSATKTAIAVVDDKHYDEFETF